MNVTKSWKIIYSVYAHTDRHEAISAHVAINPLQALPLHINIIPYPLFCLFPVLPVPVTPSIKPMTDKAYDANN